MNLIQEYVSDDDPNDHEENLCCDVGGCSLEDILTKHKTLKGVALHRHDRKFKTHLVHFEVDDSTKEEYSYISVKAGKRITNRRNRFSDVICLSDEGREKCRAVKNGIDPDVDLARWILYCPGQGNCQRACGGYGRCIEGCDAPIRNHSRHFCSVEVTASIKASDPKHWQIRIKGSHVPQGIEWEAPQKNRPIAESVKDDIMKSRALGLSSFNIFRRQLAGIDEEKMPIAFEDTRRHPVPDRVCDFIKNTQKRHSFQSGQWSEVHACVPQLKESGKLLLYQQPNVQADAHEIDKPFNLCIANQTALLSARRNQHILGIDGKHGLQDDGACLTTCVTQHKDGFGCPAAFALINRENTEAILLTLRAIIENVPCGEDDCSHDHRYFPLPGQRGYRRYTPCSEVDPYRPYVMIDKHEPSANACQQLHLNYILCWFHIVKAIMEKFKSLDLKLVTSYLLILGFKIVARAPNLDAAVRRWMLFIEMTEQMRERKEMTPATQIALVKYFNEEWWCEKWKYAWLDVTRHPLISNGQRTMTTNNHDENVNLQVADCIGGKRKKASTLLFELSGIQAPRENSGGQFVPSKKASFLDTHAAKTIAHNLGKRNRTPKDIKQRTNHARLLFLTQDIRVVEEGDSDLFFIEDHTSRVKRFRDHKGNWVTVDADACTVLQELLKSLIPDNVIVPNEFLLVNTAQPSCTCTDFLWRSGLRDPCHHIKACQMYKEGLLSDIDHVKLQEQRLLAKSVRQQQLAKPRVERNIRLVSMDDEEVMSEMIRLYLEHGSKLWETLSKSNRTETVDPHRPVDLPRDNSVRGRPKNRTVKPRAANPFKRRRIINKQTDQAGVNVQRPKGSRHPRYNVKTVRNSARRAVRLVANAKEHLTKSLLSPAHTVRDNPTPGCSSDTPGCSSDYTPVRPKLYGSIYTRLMKKKLDLKKQKKGSTPYQVQMIKMKSPGLSRGQILLKLSKLKRGELH